MKENYFLLAEFETEEEANRAYLCAGVILADLAEFREDWKKIRDSEGTAGEKLRNLLRKHPLVAKFIELPKPKKEDEMDFLARCGITEDMVMDQVGNEIQLCDVVGGETDWDYIGQLFYRLGARRVAWVSEEAIDVWEVLRKIPAYELRKKTDRLPEKAILEELLPLALAREL
ncbi:MAG: hypothetical protein QW356_02090 [Candidatus Hadarchaeales archaeon]